MFRTISHYGGLLLLACFVFAACTPQEDFNPHNQPDPELKEQLRALGFYVEDLVWEGENLILEGDIELSPVALEELLAKANLQTGIEFEQYHTFNLVNSFRTFTVMCHDCSANTSSGLDDALENYNELGLNINFVRITSGTPSILVNRISDTGWKGRAGFPEGGDPADTITIWGTLDKHGEVDVLEHVITHELGHCIGLRHTDYFDNSYSCNGTQEPLDENTVGAVHIPGTPTGYDPGTIMKACFDGSENGEFTNYDKWSLKYLYGGRADKPRLLALTGTLARLGIDFVGSTVPYRYRVGTSGPWTQGTAASQVIGLPIVCGQSYQFQSGIISVDGVLTWSHTKTINTTCPSTCPPAPTPFLLSRECNTVVLNMTHYNNVYEYKYTYANGSSSPVYSSFDANITLTNVNTCNGGSTTLSYRAYCPWGSNSWNTLVIEESPDGPGDPLGGW